jgi:hypothetical protein
MRESCECCHCCGLASPVWTRANIRALNGIYAPSYCGDAIIYLCCFECATCQDARELKLVHQKLITAVPLVLATPPASAPGPGYAQPPSYDPAGAYPPPSGYGTPPGYGAPPGYPSVPSSDPFGSPSAGQQYAAPPT